ncbi:hypothetical protein H112_02298 [Trichophyton rubrum D6]|uniref:Uncharacterized protein n=2 Tax=Trichophyton rubrum TaxID=5551 RepID=F2SUB3_TRIRC|nr:uncharacterized protein TERG_06062 [Trichophyton rubrum CBS 118892]EZF25393.1 hypothetical protein H100_02298 [Trichophyton rubrum MR850]EZF44420.1 hypothetical protein H102_02294 [Trichophyton rubrum CBS 100081]EZF55062.1 hypothetical protein H103_02307 [Trichophyton rubrum CBS 288.86]EZF65699.1 hypothetical protein H104_02280 [Trichophyton rubrum CBS 289.86]EZF86992.1 hypothetical protein H110_02302 [Trichophyton rubrum MR1448]EZF97767.1 hypothetical protein H113_02308 [Trichophyton rubr
MTSELHYPFYRKTYEVLNVGTTGVYAVYSPPPSFARTVVIYSENGTVLRMCKDLYRRRTTGTGHQKQTRKPRPRYPLQSTVPGELKAITQRGLASCSSGPSSSSWRLL